MATIYHEIHISCNPNQAWSELRNFGNAGKLFAGVLVDCQLEDSRQRTVIFANGKVIREHLISVDDERRRLAYTVVNGSFTHHNSSMQMLPVEDGVRFIWISDFLPDEAASIVEPLVRAGSQAIKQALESL